MQNINITKETYGDRIEKSPPFAKDIVVVFTNDCSNETMKAFRAGKSWKNTVLKEMILDWNLGDEDGKKLPITVESLDKIKSLRLRDWIIETIIKEIHDNFVKVKKK